MMKKFLLDNGLAVTLLAIFFISIVGMSFAGWEMLNDEAASHQQSTVSYAEYLISGEFIEGVFENWESEFLQMWALVVLTIWLRQKGAKDSKPMRGKAEQDTRSRYSMIHAATLNTKLRAVGHSLYAHSLSIALFAIFAVSFSIHAVSGAAAYNEQASRHGLPALTAMDYVSTSQFWYESLQNWQSEFLAVAALMLLSIKLRERGSPESKPVGVRYDHRTGS